MKSRLVCMCDMLKKAHEGHYAVGQFNINNLEWVSAILDECQELQAPVILGVSEGAMKYMGGCDTIVGMVNGYIEDNNITIPVALHVDHGSSFEVCKKAIDAGFTSVMIDTSIYELDENIKIVNEVCDYARIYDVSVEAEIGNIVSDEKKVNGDSLATVEDSIKLYKSTKIDSLAPAVGSIHGICKENPKLDFDRTKEISASLNIPLVLHGGTGISDEDIRKIIECGISKININTELQVVWSNSIKEYLKNNNDVYDPRKIISSGEENIKKAISDKLHLVDSCNKI